MSANDGLKYPENFQEFMTVVSRWQRAREAIPKPGEGIGDVLLRTSHELDDAVAIFRQVWAHAEAARNAGVAACLSPDGEPRRCVMWKCHEAKACARGVDVPVPALPEPPSFRLEWGGRVVAWGDAVEYGRTCFEAGRNAVVPVGRFFLRDGEWVKAAPESPVGETLYRRAAGVTASDGSKPDA